MASSRPTAASENVSTYGGAGFGRDYTALATWEAATDIDVVAALQSEVLECYDDEAHDDTVTIAGATTSATYYRIIRPASGQAHTGVEGSGVVFNATLDNSTIAVFTINEANFSLQDLCITGAGTSNVNGIVINTTSCTVVGCLVYNLTTTGTSNTKRGIHLTVNGTVVIVNCLVKDLTNAPGSSQGQGILLGSGTTAYVFNTTVVNCQFYGIRRSLGTLQAINCIVTGTQSNDDFDGTFDGSSDYNASSDGSAPGGNSNTFANFSFEDQTGGDLHLTAGDSGARDDGVSMTTNSIYPYDDDIDFTVVTTWSIGFDSDGKPAGSTPGGGGAVSDCECSGSPGEVEVANGALNYLGIANIVSFEDGTPQADLIQNIFASTRCRLQQQYRWEFCLRRLRYTSDDTVTNVPLWGFDFGFLLPSLLIQLWKVDKPHENPRFRMENKHLLIDNDNPDILYSVEETDPDKWSCTFKEAFELKLASRLAMPLLHKPELMQLYEEMFQEKIAEAAFLNDIQSDDYSAYSAHFAEARYGFFPREIPLELD